MSLTNPSCTSPKTASAPRKNANKSKVPDKITKVRKTISEVKEIKNRHNNCWNSGPVVKPK